MACFWSDETSASKLYPRRADLKEDISNNNWSIACEEACEDTQL